VNVTDPVADLLTRIRNANSIRKRTLKMPYSSLKKNILRVLKEQGFIADYIPEMEGQKAVLRVELKYGPDGELVLQHLQRVSKPGRRVYSGVRDLPNVLNGLGIAVLSTPKGVMSNLEAKKLSVGGEVLCEVW